MNRSRSSDKRQKFTGTRTVWSSVSTWSGYRGGTLETCHDTVGERQKANPFTLIKQTPSDWSLSGVNGPYAWDECPMAETRGYGVEPFVPSQAWANSFYLTIVGRTNPQAPKFSIPTAIGELKDLPALIKNAGDLVGLGDRPLPVKAGNASLGWQFGVMPLIDDLGSLYNFGNSLQGFLRGLMGLQGGKPIRRRCFLGQEKSDIPPGGPQVVHSLGGLHIHATFQGDFKNRYWGSCAWEPTLATKVILEKFFPNLDRAWLLAGGFTPIGAFRTAWNLIPWSWLVDWFFHVDALLGALDNTLLLLPTDVCLMYGSTNVMFGSIVYKDGPDIPVVGVHRRKLERKHRFVLAPTGSFGPSSMPFIDGRRASILGSLAAQRSG